MGKDQRNNPRYKAKDQRRAQAKLERQLAKRKRGKSKR